MASNRKRSRGWINAYDMGQGEGPIVPLTVMHRKRVTSELHDSYFCLMTIKHPISKIQKAIVWALNYYLTQLSSGSQAVASRIPDSWRPDVVGKATPDRGGPRKPPMQLPADFQTVETRCGREGHTRPRRPSESPDGVEPNIRRTRTTQRDGHNSGVKIWCLCSVSSTLSHANLEQPFRTLAIKRGVNIFLKKSSCVFLPASFIPAFSLLRLYRCVAVNYSTYICACM